MFKEFKEFISRGNVIDLAVGVVMGSAFTAIVNSLVNDIIMPLVGLIVGGIDFTSLSFGIGDAAVCYGNFIQAVVNFLIVAFVIFMVVKGINKMHEKLDKKQEESAPEEPAAPAEDIVLLTEIRDLLKK